MYIVLLQLFVSCRISGVNVYVSLRDAQADPTRRDANNYSKKSMYISETGI